jgi:hypothetical protein
VCSISGSLTVFLPPFIRQSGYMTEPNGASADRVAGDAKSGSSGPIERAMGLLRRVLKYQVSTGALIEVALWLAIPYLSIGLVWSFFHAEQIQQIQTRLEKVSPAGADVAAFGFNGGIVAGFDTDRGCVPAPVMGKNSRQNPAGSRLVFCGQYARTEMATKSSALSLNAGLLARNAATTCCTVIP